MKKLLTALILLLVSSTSFANGYCDGRPSQQDQDTCYKVVIETNNATIARRYTALMQSHKYTKQQKMNLQSNQKDWMLTVNSQCRTNSCVDNSMTDRIALLYREFEEHGK
jgi:uncharacterized protein YecT (DUF1311 family)